MTLDPVGDVTRLLAATREGDEAARDRLLEVVYDDLRSIARRTPFVGGDGETLQPTALANEAVLRLKRRVPRLEGADRRCFFRLVALAMRTIVRDEHRRRIAAKRGGGRPVVALGDQDPAERPAGCDSLDVVALDSALDGLERYNRRWYDVVMHRYYAGRTIEETAELLEIAPATVKSDWHLARAWLLREIEG